MTSLGQRICQCFYRHTPVAAKRNASAACGDVLPPRPSTEELDSQFLEVVEELDLDLAHREAISQLPPDKKWQIIVTHRREREDATSSQLPTYYNDRIRSMTTTYWTRNDEEIAERLKIIENLKTALRTQTIGFVQKFIELGGLQTLLDMLALVCQTDFKLRLSVLHSETIGCVRALMNSSHGRTHVLSHPDAICVITQSLRGCNAKTGVVVLEMLGAVCLVRGGHKKVLDAMYHFQRHSQERTRFQTIISMLSLETEDPRDELALKTAVVSFFNALIKCGPGQERLEFRLHLRYELLMLGIQPAFDALRNVNPILDRHIEFFEHVRSSDEREFARKFDQTHVNCKSAGEMFELLKKKLQFSPVYPALLSIVQHLLILTSKENVAVTGHWQLIDRIVQQVAIVGKGGQNPDIAPIEVDINKVLRQLGKEGDIVEIERRIKESQKECDELKAKVDQSERECESKNKELVDMETTLGRMRQHLEQETQRLTEAQLRITQLESVTTQLSSTPVQLAEERRKGNSSTETPSIDIPSSQSITPLSAPVPPPPAPPPPPPGAPPAPGLPGAMYPSSMKKKNIPTPSQALKSFNWSKLPEHKIEGTVWKDADDEQYYTTLDLSDFEKNFSAYQRQGLDESNSPLEKLRQRPKELSVIDGRRAQNCNILLSKFKLTSEKVITAVENMNEAALTIDLIEQLLKFVPSADELSLLREHEQEIDKMARADRFLLEISRVPHYGERLLALQYKMRFSDRLADLNRRVDAVTMGCRQVIASRTFKSLLSLVLAVGNYMNRGARGNAYGFRLSSLCNIQATKNSLTPGCTLLHYLVQLLDDKFPEVAEFEEDISAASEASKIGWKELLMEVHQLKKGLQDIKTEVEYFQSHSTGTAADKFVHIMSRFLDMASFNLNTDLEAKVTEMKEKYDRAARMYAEEPDKLPSEEFFKILDEFCSCCRSARADNERNKLQKEEEEKRSKLETLLRKSSPRKKSTDITDTINEAGRGEFDHMISALITGDAFGKDFNKPRRVKAKRPNPSNNLFIDSRERESSPALLKKSQPA